MWSTVALVVLGWTVFVQQISAYIPAVGTNDTEAFDVLYPDSTILLRWTDLGNYGEQVSRQLVKEGGSDGISKGALVHFVENATIPAEQATTTTPWIAFVCCDRNSSDASQDLDIFTQARDRGAVAALLYSTTSVSCLLNDWYRDPEEFDQVFDIYTTITRSSARLIESQFQNVNKSQYYYFNANRLNESAYAITEAINGTSVEEGYLIATLKLNNVTDPAEDTPFSGNNGNQNDDDDNNSNTGLAMIILYAITGCVSALFCVVIISGAIRAFRHPERYGPRPGDPNVQGPEGQAQTRTAGLTRAILDTFPVVKFGRATNNTATSRTMQSDHKPKMTDVEQNADGKEVYGIELLGRSQGTDPYSGQQSPSNQDSDNRRHTSPTAATAFATSSRTAGNTTDQQDVDEISPQTIGRETCPICILDFEEGDDLRVLPCEGKHTFHRDCVDPWLLELSSSCPLCRKDFYALENMVRGVPPEEALETSQDAIHSTSLGTRLSKYIRVASQRRNARSHSPRPQSSGSHDVATSSTQFR
ncbi:hypothetical protein FRC02_001018 [Tulasnella sp. 418]|nr:hypothetical protein FRC02_001018 [Tulasnella sp. 418]